MEALQADRIREVNVIAPPRSGKTLIADVASPEVPNDKAGQTLGEPMFELPLSGWYCTMQSM